MYIYAQNSIFLDVCICSESLHKCVTSCQVSIFVQDRIQLLDGSFKVSIAGPVPGNSHIPGSKTAGERASNIVETVSDDNFRNIKCIR
jgi:hypothetical protein